MPISSYRDSYELEYGDSGERSVYDMRKYGVALFISLPSVHKVLTNYLLSEDADSDFESFTILFALPMEAMQMTAWRRQPQRIQFYEVESFLTDWHESGADVDAMQQIIRKIEVDEEPPVPGIILTGRRDTYDFENAPKAAMYLDARQLFEVDDPAEFYQARAVLTSIARRAVAEAAASSYPNTFPPEAYSFPDLLIQASEEQSLRCSRVSIPPLHEFLPSAESILRSHGGDLVGIV